VLAQLTHTALHHTIYPRQYRFHSISPLVSECFLVEVDVVLPPSLCRHYPASSVLRGNPTPCCLLPTSLCIACSAYSQP